MNPSLTCILSEPVGSEELRGDPEADDVDERFDRKSCESLYWHGA